MRLHRSPYAYVYVTVPVFRTACVPCLCLPSFFHPQALLLSRYISRRYRFDFSGNGESEGEFGYGNYAKEAEDLGAALDALQAEGLSVRAVFGHSKGAQVVLMHAARASMRHQALPYQMIVPLAARADVSGGVKERLGEERLRQIAETGECFVAEASGRGYRVTKANLEERMNTDVLAEVAAIPPSLRVALLHGDRDVTAPLSGARDLARTIRGATLDVLPGDHFFEGPDRLRLLDRVTELVLEGL